MPFEIDNIFDDYKRSKSRQFTTYSDQAHSPTFSSVIGYVADVDELSRLTNTYNVSVPGLSNVMLRQVPRKVPGAFSQANGVGHLSPPLRPGQPVLVKFINNRTSLPYIDGSFFLNGQFEEWANGKFPTVDEKDKQTNLSIYPTPLPPEALAIKNDAEVRVYPLVVRTSSPTQPPNTASSLEVPGTTYITDSTGNTFTYFAGERIVVGKNEQKATEGARQSMADMPKQQALLKAQRLQAEAIESLAHWRTAIGGQIELKSQHPANRKRSKFAGSSSSSFSSSSNSPLASLQGLPGLEHLGKALSIIEEISNLLDFASAISGQQMNFLQSKILPLVEQVKALWGGHGKFGMKIVSFQVDLPLNIQLSVSLSFDAKTGKLTLDISIGFNNGTPIQGSQPLPIRSEGALIVGGRKANTNSQILVYRTYETIQQSTIYFDFPSLIGYSPEQLQPSRIPYTVVSRDLSKLNFAQVPYHGLASLLTQYGIKDALPITQYLDLLTKHGSVFDFIKLAALLAQPTQKLIILLGLMNLGDFASVQPIPAAALANATPTTETPVNPELANLISSINKPATTSCPTYPPKVYEVMQASQYISLADRQPTIDSFFDHLQLPKPDYSQWSSIPSFMQWAAANPHPYYPALKELQAGSIASFLILTTFLKTGIDLRAYPDSFDELMFYIDTAYPIPRVGAFL